MAELTYTRVFDAPRELVFGCMLEPEHLTRFWGPAARHPENQARFLSSLDRFAAYLKTL
jgi:uncharacterized protein YndB with AHSA1/START domain